MKTIGKTAAVLCFLAFHAAAWAEMPAPTPAATPTTDPPSFQRDIYPILERRCVSCHNEQKHEGQLSLHDRAAIERGGESGHKLVNVALAENELWRRVAGVDAEVRMPAEGPPLAAEDLATIERWARAGAPWPSPRAVPPPDNSAATNWLLSLVPTWLDGYLLPLEQLRLDYGSVLYLALALLAFVIVTLRLKAAGEPADGDAASAAEPVSPFIQFLRNYVTAPTYLLLAFAVAAWAGWLYVAKGHAREEALAAKIQSLDAQVQKLTQPPPANSAASLEPVRPKHPPRLGGTYYRGNDERSDKLYNGGFYRTATMELALCDLNDRRLAWGDKLPARDVFVRVEIERAAGATPTLFTPAIMAKAFLSPIRPAVKTPGLASLVFPVRTVTEGERWVGHAPLKLPAPAAGDTVLSGELFLYNCLPASETIPEQPHFGIRYAITVKEGVIQPGSDLWMGSLYRLASGIYPPTDKILPNEWFDSRPIPEIEGENSTDPKLLGVPEHQRKP